MCGTRGASLDAELAARVHRTPHVAMGNGNHGTSQRAASHTLIDDMATAVYHLNGFMRNFFRDLGVLRFRNLVCWLMIVLWPLSCLAADANAAVLRSKGGVWVNDAEAVDSTPVFPGDRIEAKPGFVAELDAEGSSVLIQPESILKFQGTFIELEHGNISVGTSASLGVHVSCLQVEPITSQRTEYNVKDTTGSVEVVAVKSDVKFTQVGAIRKTSKESGVLGSAVLHEGQEEKRQESDCGAGSQAPTAAHSFPTKWLEIGGGVAGAVALCLVFCKSSPKSDISPSDP
jgi:hypothetical protein